MSNTAVVIVAAGRGERIGQVEGFSSPKQYRQLDGVSILQHTINRFLEVDAIGEIQVVIHADDFELYEANVSPNKRLLQPVIGGATRSASCGLGVEALIDKSFERILIHDAARPFVSKQTIQAVIEAIEPSVCALPASIISSTIKRRGADGYVIDTVDRTDLFTAQTPQGLTMYDALMIHRAARTENLDHFTDDAALAEWHGLKVRLVEVTDDNPKITTAGDLLAAQKRMEAEMNDVTGIPDVRTGHGYDTHTLVMGDTITLCGLELPHDKSLSGHSDADVGLHALTDALLGAICAGDIGSHFPPSDPQWKGASSDRFLNHACKLVETKGGHITHLDVTLICEAPKIGPHRDAMRNRIAKICDLPIERVSVKATTNEKVGFIGREEGIAAMATATVILNNKNQ